MHQKLVHKLFGTFYECTFVTEKKLKIESATEIKSLNEKNKI